MENDYILSKSKYCKGLQCLKILWMDENKPECSEEGADQAILNTGTRVGELAHKYFGEYERVEFSLAKEDMVNSTKALMSSGATNIAEASFLYNGLFCSVDILHKNGDGWDIVEVKSSTHVEEIYIDDMAFQYYVLSNCGVSIKSVVNMHIDNTYVKNGDLDIKRLFILEDCTNDVTEKAYGVQENISRIINVAIESDEPQIDIGIYCEKPYKCAYKGYCGRNLPEQSVFDIAGMQSKKKYALYRSGIISYEDILKNPDKVNSNQMRQVDAIYNKKPDEYDAFKIKEFLNTLSYPIYHLDFETFQSAVPEFDGSSPYEQIPFQYSLHIESETGKLEHKEFLAVAEKDPRRELAESLIADIPKNSCVTAYNMSFEKNVLRHLSSAFGDLSEHLMNIHDNIHDLMIPFQKRYYYSAAMQGSYSIKYVLPALWPGDPELDYHNLENVHNGSEASAAYANMNGMADEDADNIRRNLLEYCRLDTYAMVKVLHKLKEVSISG